MNYKTLVYDLIEEHKKSPIDMLDIGSSAEQSEYAYLRLHSDSFIRTVRDIDELGLDKSSKILELGAFLGPVSKALKKIGYDVHALDIPEFFQSDRLRKSYEKFDIPFVGVNLREKSLPYEDCQFDVVILCEVLEHLNFNPLPALKEINRILKTGGILYIGMPNQAFFLKRLKLLFGLSINNSISDFFSQLDRTKNMIVGIHWREYTMRETKEMINEMGFETLKAYYFSETSTRPNNTGKFIIKKLLSFSLYLIPSFNQSQVVIGRKTQAAQHDFWEVEANS